MRIESQGNKVENTNKKHRPTWLVALLILFVILFLLTTAIVGARLYERATADQYKVDLGLGGATGEIELFRIEYRNEQGEVVVKGKNADNVVAPGTSVSYDVRLRNNEDVIIDFVMLPFVEFLNESPVPVEFKIVDDYGNYILGSETAWVSAKNTNDFIHKGSIHPGEIYTYHITWQWAFEVGDEENAYDTYLGNQAEGVLPGVRVGIETESYANPVAPRDNRHMMHLLGDGVGCCWCCYLVWVFILATLVILIFAQRKIKKLEKANENQETI